MDFLSGLFGGIKNLFGGAGKAVSGLGGMFGGGGGAPSFAKPSGQSNMLSAIGGPNQFMPKQGGGMSGMGGFGGILDSIFPGGKAQGLGGLAIPAIGNMFAPKVSMPDISQRQSVKALESFRPGQSVSPEYQEMLQRNTGRLRDQRLKQLQRVYKTARPGTDYTTDTNYQRDLAEIERGVQEQLGDSLASAEGQFSQQEQSRLENLAQMDVYSIMAQTGLDAQEANDFKQMFSNAGNIFLTSATKKPGYDFSSLFGGA